MPQGIDQYTFEFAELKGKAYYSAFGKVTKDFIHAFRGNKHYEVMLSAFLQRIFEDPDVVSQENLKYLENNFVERVNAMLSEERAQDKERLAKGRKPVYELQQEDEEEDGDEPVLTEAELRQQEEERLERERRDEERRALREEERRRNEEALRARARQVDTKAMEKFLQDAVVLNPGQLKLAGGDKQRGGAAAATPMEALGEMELQVKHLMKEKERLQTVLHTSEDELPAKLEEAKQQRDSLLSGGNNQDGDGRPTNAKKPPMQEKQINARLAELKQKVSKLTMERNRLALQLKAQPHPMREEILLVMQQRDETQIKLEQA